MPHGTVTWFDADRGFGFLTPDDGSPDVFVHARDVLTSGAGPKSLVEGQAVDFEVVEGDRGPQAREVRPAGPPPAQPQTGVLATVSWFDPVKGYGFAVPDGSRDDVFVHATAVVTGAALEEGQRVAFVVAQGERGPVAESVVPLARGAGEQRPDDGGDGTVTWYDPEKGFGFLAPDSGGPDVFVHFRSLGAGVEALEEGQRVAFSVVEGDRGPQARDARPVGSGGGARRERRDDRRDDSGPRGARRPSGGAPVRGGEGVVVRYDADRGFGFLRPDAGGDDLFVHVSVVQGEGPLEVGDRVRFGVRQSDRGPQADRVERL